MAEELKHDELHDDIVENEEVVEEAHDPENAEQQSIDSVDKAAKASTQAPAPKTKGKMIAAMYNRMSKMKKEELYAAYNKMMESVELEDEVLAEDLDTGAALDALVEGEATLSEEFKEKTSLIFEAALRSKLSEEVDRLEEAYQTELAEEVQATKTDMVDKVDSYLNYVVESWMEDNKLAIEAGLRTEIAENFMSKLKDVFVESYIEVPKSKVDLVDDLTEQVVELEEKLNEAVADSIELSESLRNVKRVALIAEASRDMAQTQAEKLNDLLEGVAFEDETSFASKVETIKESFFGKVEVEQSQVTLAESLEADSEVEEEVELSASMSQYLKHLKKQS
jgi:hypothetical protein